jgi:hypothetical protein
VAGRQPDAGPRQGQNDDAYGDPEDDAFFTGKGVMEGNEFLQDIHS